MSRGVLLWVLFAMLAGLAFESGLAGRDARERSGRPGRGGEMKVMDGGDGFPPPSTT